MTFYVNFLLEASETYYFYFVEVPIYVLIVQLNEVLDEL